MKRFLSMLLASLLILSMAVVFVVPATAAEFEGDWIATRNATGYDEENADSYTPAAGYHYTSKGFETICPDYTGLGLRQDVNTRNKVDIKANNDGNGYSVNLKFTVSGFTYGGDLGQDHWICLCLSSGSYIGVPSTEYGEGLCILIRGNGDGAADFQPHYVDNEKKVFAGINPKFGASSNIELHDDGSETYTFTVRYSEGKYYIGVCDYEFQDDELDKLLDRACADGAYVGIALHDGTKDVQGCTINISEWQGDFPTGDDSAQPEENINEPIAEIVDSATVEANKPAVLWDSQCIQHTKIDMTGAEYLVNEDGSINMKANNQASYFTFGVKRAFSYQAADFPYIAVLTQNCMADSGTLWFCAGDIGTATNDYKETFDFGDYGDVLYDNGWSLSLIDLSDYDEDGWTGRINSLRFDWGFNNADDILEEEYNNWNVAFAGAFRSPEEAKAYTEAWLTEKGYNAGEVTTEEVTTEAPTEPDETDPADSESGDNSEEQTTGSDVATSCKSLVALPVVAMVAMLGVAFVAKKKD